MPALRIGICNPHDDIRAGKALLINSQNDLRVVFESQSAADLMHKIPDLTLDVLVIDHRLEGTDGATLVTEANKLLSRRGQVPPKMIVTAPFFTVDLDVAVIRSGAADFVVDESGPEQLLSSIRSVARKNDEVNVFALKDMFKGAQLKQRSDAQFQLLRQELEDKCQPILEGFIAGYSDVELAEKLEMSELRIRQLFKRILGHFGFTTRQQLLLALFESSMLD